MQLTENGSKGFRYDEMVARYHSKQHRENEWDSHRQFKREERVVTQDLPKRSPVMPRYEIDLGEKRDRV